MFSFREVYQKNETFMSHIDKSNISAARKPQSAFSTFTGVNLLQGLSYFTHNSSATLTGTQYLSLRRNCLWQRLEISQPV